MAHGPIPLDEAVPIFLQIAEGLDSAHEKGIIHRDLKPANVKLTPSDEVKILDFGLAKAFAEEIPEADTSMSPTITRNATRAGVILGTAEYMSPEQAKGKSVDKRTDIWSFGVVLYEALTGKRLFTGETVSDVMAAVLTREVDSGAVPARIRSLLDRCLERDPKRRLRDIGEARIALEKKEAPERLTSARLPTVLPWAIAALLAALALLTGRARPERAEVPLRRFAIELPWHTMPNWDDFVAAISPTGTHIAYNGRHGNDVDVYVRALDELDGQPLADARELFTPMVFSSDGEWIAMFFASELRKVSIHGGEPQIVARLEELRVAGLSWGSHDDILLGTSSGLYQVPSTGGSPVAVTRLDTDDGELGQSRPHRMSKWRKRSSPTRLKPPPMTTRAGATRSSPKSSTARRRPSTNRPSMTTTISSTTGLRRRRRAIWKTAPSTAGPRATTCAPTTTCAPETRAPSIGFSTPAEDRRPANLL